MHEEIKARRERRRRRLEGTVSDRNEIQTTFEYVEQSAEAHEAQNSGIFLRRDTFTVPKPKSDLDVASDGEQLDRKSAEGSVNDSYELKNLTYSVSKTSESMDENHHHLDNSGKTRDENEYRPVAAPRKRKIAEPEKLSSDTDKDVTEIDLDDLRLKSTKSDPKSPEPDVKSIARSNVICPPVPKPRKAIKSFQKEPDSEKSNPDRGLNESSLNSDLNDVDERRESNEFPLIKNLLQETKDLQKNPPKKKFANELFHQKKKKRKTNGRLLSLMKSEKKKFPKISALLKNVKDDEKDIKAEEIEDKADVQTDSPHYPESTQNGQIYVQSKRGFYLMERNEVFKNENSQMDNEENGGRMPDSTVKTALTFQSYWSRAMIYFHGILAGFGFGHAATVTAMMMHYNYEPQPFVGVYSSLSLKTHYVFYALTALCIVSCLDRLDIGHINRKHMQVAWKTPSSWMILCFYSVSFVLSFSNQTAEARFDSFARANHTKVWWTGDEQVSLLQWYHTVWARDVLVLFAWLLISLTKFPDFLHAHLNNMIRYAEMKGEGINLHRLSRQKIESP